MNNISLKKLIKDLIINTLLGLYACNTFILIYIYAPIFKDMNKYIYNIKHNNIFDISPDIFYIFFSVWFVISITILYIQNIKKTTKVFIPYILFTIFIAIYPYFIKTWEYSLNTNHKTASLLLIFSSFGPILYISQKPKIYEKYLIILGWLLFILIILISMIS